MMPCESKHDIEEIKKRQGDQAVSLGVFQSQMNSLNKEVSEFIKESREVIQLLKDMATEAREGQRQTARVQEVLFQKNKEREEDLKDLEKRTTTLEAWKEAQVGRGSVIRDIRFTIPVVCALITTAILVYEKVAG